MKQFPILCLDDFYDDPDQIREWALSLDFDQVDDGKYPGKRTKSIHEINPEFFENFCNKLFSVYYDFNVPVSYEVDTSFQLIESYSDDPNSMKNKGWVHLDTDTIAAGIIYLNKETNSKTGTSIFDLIGHYDKDQLKRKELYRDGIDNLYDEHMQNHLEQYRETIRFSSKYNRLISFDGLNHHAANSFYGKEPRLTQVFFINKLETKSLSPLDRVRKYNG
jgi:hypothetical protein